MADPCRVEIFEGNAAVCDVPLGVGLELGRQRDGEPEPYKQLPSPSGLLRLIIAPQQARENISRRHLSLIPLDGGRVRVTNHSQTSVSCDGAAPIASSASIELTPPFCLSVGSRFIRVVSADHDEQEDVEMLEDPTRGPSTAADVSFSSRFIALLQPAQMLALLEAMPRVQGVLQSAVGATDFLTRASQAIVQIVGLDTGRVLIRQRDGWKVVAHYGASDKPGWQPSRHVLERLLAARSTVWQRVRQATDAESLVMFDTVVAAPLLDRNNNVIGILYGERRRGGTRPGGLDSRVQALLVDLLASGVATGLARVKHEQAAVRAETRFEQFFSPELARSLAADPTMLQPREAHVTVLFCDVRGFSKYSEKLGAAETFRWINDVMEELSNCVRKEEGVLVDYIGDELMAMWGAPQKQDDQAERAVRAGLAMLACLPRLDERWQTVLGESLRIGVGVNSGLAQVGNTGSKVKFKYGPLGNTVNLGSRIQGLTKYLRCGLLVSGETRRALGSAFLARRVVRARVVNISEAVELYEVVATGSAEFFRESEAALDALERGEFAVAARTAGSLLAQHPGDGPLLVVLSRAADALIRGGDFTPVWIPPGK